MTILTVPGSCVSHPLPEERERSVPHVRRWIIEDKEISIFEKRDQLSYELLDNITGKSIIGPVDLADKSIEIALSYLLKCEPQVLETGGLKFCPKLPTHLKWVFRNNKIYLLKKGEDLIWQLFDKNTKTISRIPFESGLLHWDVDPRHFGCFFPWSEILAKHRKVPLSKHEFFKNSVIDKFELKPTPHSLAFRLSAVYAKKITGNHSNHPEPSNCTTVLTVPGGGEIQSVFPEEDEVPFFPEEIEIPVPYIRRWIIDDKEVSLIRKNDQLIYQIIENGSDEIIEGSLDLNDGNIERVIRVLLKSQPVILESGSIEFCLKPKHCFEWVFRNNEIRLFNQDEALIWELFDKSTKTFSQTPFRNSFLNWEGFANYYGYFKESNPLSVDKFLDKYKKYNIDQVSLVRYFQDCQIEKIELTPTPGSLAYRLGAVHAKKIVGKSLLDPSVLIDNENWAVTIVNTGKSQLFQPISWAGHAALIIEGRDKGAFFKYKAHLKLIEGVPTVLLEKIKKGKLSDCQKGETWRVPRYEVEQMLEAIKWEISKQRANDPQIYFDLRGSAAKRVNPIEIKEYNSYRDVIEATLGAECLNPSLAPSQPVPYRSITLRDKNGRQWSETNAQFASDFSLNLQREFSSPQQMFIEQSDGKWLEVRIPDNCMTWVKRKLADCGVLLQGDTLNAIFAFPKRYMSKGLGLQNSVNEYSPREHSVEEVTNYPLICAIENHDITKVENLLAQGAEPKAKGPNGMNALHHACFEGDIRLVKFFLDKGMDINEPSAYYFSPTPLLLALDDDKLQLVEFLIKSGADVDQQDGETGNTITHYLLDDSEDSNYPLHDETRFEILSILIKHGVNFNIKNNNGDTPLIIAVKEKKIKLAYLFLQHGAAIDEPDKDGRTALWHACNNEDEEMVRLLIECEANLLTSSTNGFSNTNPYLLVHERKLYNIVQLMEMASKKRLQELEKAEKRHTCLVS